MLRRDLDLGVRRRCAWSRAVAFVMFEST